MLSGIALRHVSNRSLSYCLKVPALCKGGKTRGVTVVISPLIALMSDQVNHLKAKNIDVALLSSDQGTDAYQEARQRLNSDNPPELLYVTPERLEKSDVLRSTLKYKHRNGELARFVIDEAHCISTWGRDFRDSVRINSRCRRCLRIAQFHPSPV